MPPNRPPALLCLALMLAWLSTAAAAPPAGVPALDHPPPTVTRTTAGQVDLCLGCHRQDPGGAHARDVLGCAACHLGDPLAGDKTRAHRGMVKNPGELRLGPRTCGQAGCHPNQLRWVENSLMATNRGIIDALRTYWGESAGPGAEDLTVHGLARSGLTSPALDYFRKLCGSCHLWMEKGSLPDFLAAKGGGCTACHQEKPEPDTPRERAHTRITRDAPLENCVRCHNRSGRIGLSYQGLMESEGYGTPYEAGDLGTHQLEDGRYVRSMPDDVHHRKGLACVDCHTQRETMGDGTRHVHFEEQLEVRCVTCHAGGEALRPLAEAYALRKRGLGPPSGVQVKRAPPRLDVVAKGTAFFLEGRRDRKLHPLDPVSY
ncbi:hypothetical protein G3N55_11410, partial [Dissulfurirhabdus thermomarina]|nr:hypothetical protein [Dissulfurirhabdus thermomarina]